MLILTSFQVRMPEFVVSISSTIGVANVFLAMFMVGMMFEMNIKKEYIKDAVVIILLRYGVAAVLSVLVYFCLLYTSLSHTHQPMPTYTLSL